MCECKCAFMTIPWLRAADMRLSERTSIPGAHAATQSVDAVEHYFGDVLSQPIRMNERSFNKVSFKRVYAPASYWLRPRNST